MANSFVTVPNVLPGNVTVGGNLTVQGNELTVGSFTEKLHLAVDSADIGKLTWNIKQGGNTRDNAAKQAHALYLGNGGTQPELQRINSAGSAVDNALLLMLLSDYTSHTNTGNTTENTILSKTLRANQLGANGALRITIGLTADVQGAVQSTIRVKLGGTSLCAWSPVAADNGLAVNLMGMLFNVNSASVQKGIAWKVSTNGTFSTTPGVGAVNTAADQTLAITAQCGSASDQQTIVFIAVELVNTYGPVT